MKVILVILAMVCTVYAMPERLERLKRELDIEQLRNTCPGKCLDEDDFRQAMSRLAPKGNQVAQSFRSGGRPRTNMVSDINFDLLCTDVQKIQTCVSKCNKPEDAEVKRKAEAILVVAKDLSCSPETKTAAACFEKLEQGNAPSRRPARRAWNYYNH